MLLLGRKHIAKAEDLLAAFGHLGVETDYVLFPGLHYVVADRAYATSFGEVPVCFVPTKLGYYVYHFSNILWLLVKQFRTTRFDTLFAIDWFEGVILLLYRALFARTAKVIYYSYDYYFPQSLWSSRTLINRIDAFVAARADEVWNVNVTIGRERNKRGVTPKQSHTVPLGIRVQVPPWETRACKHLLFVGNLKQGHFLERLIPLVSKLSAEDASLELTIVGRGKLRERLGTRVRDKGLSSRIHLRGFVSQEDLVREISSGRYACGLALYEDTPEIRCADPGKIKDYFSWGLPVLVTRYPAIAQDVIRYSLGCVIDRLDEATLRDTLSRLDFDRLRQWQENVRRYASGHSSEAVLKERLGLV